MSFAPDQPALNDMDAGYHLTIFHAGMEPPPLPSIPAELVLEPDAKLYVSNDDQSSIANLSQHSSLVNVYPQSPLRTKLYLLWIML